MDVLEKDFKGNLLEIISNIAHADFISIDLEMTGMVSRLGSRTEKPSMQQFYSEIRAAAQKFQVLQIGVTCVELTKDKGYYIARPYNVYVSPQVLPYVNKNESFARVSAMDSSAMGFLLKNGMDFGKVFNHGVTYLSAADEKTLRKNRMDFESRMTKKEAVVFGPNDDDALLFLGDVERKLKSWMDEELPKNDWLNISLPSREPLNGLQRRIVHQATSKYEGFAAKVQGKGAFMQIQRVWPDEKIYIKNKWDKVFELDMIKQKGLTWIFKAITGGDLTGLEPKWFARPHSEDPEHQIPFIEKKIQDLSSALQSKDRVLIGHNMFGDLCFLYHMFVGPLPEKFDDFRREIHELLPFIIDTKFMVTEAGNSMSPDSNLVAAVEHYKRVHVPMLCLHEDFTSYGPGCKKEHEAGFDSWMTVELFIKLTAELFSKTPAGMKALLKELKAEANETPNNERKLRNERKPNITSGNIPKAKNAGGFEISNPYEALANMSISEPSTPVTVTAAVKFPIGSRKIVQWLPPTSSAFWEKYMDKLRINRCIDGMCDLSVAVTGVGEDDEETEEDSLEYFSCEGSE